MDDVPSIVQGAWRRRWIRYSNGTFDDTEIVMWLQLAHRMVDVRFSADRAELADRGSLDGCDLADLLRLAESDSSSGYTTCTPVERNPSGQRTATAQWLSDSGVSFQPFTNFPEPGILEWNEDGTVMTERAPSGHYVEEWHLVAGTAGVGTIHDRPNGSQRFEMGPLVIEVDDRRPQLDRSKSLTEQIQAATDIAGARALVDCEFSLAEVNAAGDAVVIASTHPWRIGECLGRSAP